MCSIWCRMFQRKSEMPHSSPAFEYVTWLIPLSFHESLWFDRIRLCSWALVSLCAFCFRPLIFFSPQGDSTSRRSEKNPLLRNELKKTTRGIYKLRQQSVFPFVKTFFHKKVLTLANAPPPPHCCLSPHWAFFRPCCGRVIEAVFVLLLLRLLCSEPAFQQRERQLCYLLMALCSSAVVEHCNIYYKHHP